MFIAAFYLYYCIKKNNNLFEVRLHMNSRNFWQCFNLFAIWTYLLNDIHWFLSKPADVHIVLPMKIDIEPRGIHLFYSNAAEHIF